MNLNDPQFSLQLNTKNSELKFIITINTFNATLSLKQNSKIFKKTITKSNHYKLMIEIIGDITLTLLNCTDGFKVSKTINI